MWNMTVRALAAILATAAVSAGSQALAQSSDLTGQWVHEGEQQEIVIRSSIQQRTYSAPGDFALGSATPTTVVTTTPTPTQIRRQMALIVQPDGNFSWISEESYDESASCRVFVHQTKVGRLAVSASEARFTIERGNARSSRNCNDNVYDVDIIPRVDTYSLTRSGDGFTLDDGKVSWAFQAYHD